MKTSPELEQASIVFLGSFNPAIFHPSWFAAHDLIPCDDQKVPKGINRTLVLPEITDFSTEDFSLQVQAQRFALRTTNASFYESLRDLAYSTFSILHHTPIIKMGLNRDFHFRMPDIDAWHEIGHRLAPKEHWKGLLHHPGLRHLSMEGERQDDYKGFIRVIVEPSNEIKPHGVHIGVNDHYEVHDPEKNKGSIELIEILQKMWSKSINSASKTAQTIIWGEEMTT